MVTIKAQVNGIYIDDIIVDKNAKDEIIRESVLGDSYISKFIGNEKVIRVVIVPNRLVNVITDKTNGDWRWLKKDLHAIV